MNIADIKLPPHHIEAEKWVLACIFLDNQVMYILEGMAMAPEDFYQKEHSSIYQAIKELRNSRKTIDVVTVSDILQKQWQLELIGNNEYLYELSLFVMTPSVCAEYADIVKQKSILRNILKVSQHIIWDVYDEKDTNTIIDQIEKRIFELTQLQFGDTTIHIKELLSSRIAEYMDIVDHPEKKDEHKVMSWYHRLDDISAGFKWGELIILAARPSMGKTAFAINLMTNASMYQWKSTVLFSLEMGTESITDRIISLVSGVGFSKIVKGNLNEDDFASIGWAISKLSDCNIYIDEKWGNTVPMIKSKLRKLIIEKWHIDLVVIDYLQLISSAGQRYAGNRVQEVSEISRSLKELAKELRVPIIALSQLSRENEKRPDKRPQLSDLRDSGAIEQDADLVMFLYRDEFYDSDTDRKGISDILVRKNRNGETGDIELKWKAVTMEFQDIK